jgi:DNA-binding response OmpR family regulator
MAKILIVEDDPLMSQLFQRAFMYQKHEVIIAHNGQEGLEKAKDFNPELVLLDVMMPVMNGIETLERLKQDPDLKEIPVIMLTNLSGGDDTAMALSKGSVRYIIKSEHDPDEVVKMVEDMMRNQWNNGSADDDDKDD